MNQGSDNCPASLEKILKVIYPEIVFLRKMGSSASATIGFFLKNPIAVFS
ncbi:Uncharacterized protein dnm_008920 [Desulfonema magnum]|uniref:Uncharacterized protein n=1 Tax=Desulfonema magnum TaxID=45655 RepID=A0A975BFP5_9BACT|nr:Uncharacterized protein dnm_008920 [Desulfonema magnum]